jgi:23S rRNA (cytidine1920-2'-O)/16S rRNA (cytidine1409-2'-O)-methyltransferase
MAYASRAGEKLEHALKEFSAIGGSASSGKFLVENLTCADFGSSTGGFVDCLLQHGAQKVYAVETGYGVLDWKLRNNPLVVVMEKKNAMHVELPEKVDLITIDTSWTKLEKVVPNALLNLKPDGHLITLVKPHYEASQPRLIKGKLPETAIPEVLHEVRAKLKALGLEILGEIESPLLGEKSKNKEFLFYLKRA